MKRTEIQSSLITSWGHEKGVLEVEFKNGTVYRYPGVTEDVFNILQGAESPGRAFIEHVRVSLAGEKVDANEQKEE